LTSPPSDAGQYTVRASFAGNPNYNGSHDDKTVNVAKADSTTSVSWSDWTFDTTAHLASATVKGVGGALIGTPDPTFAYYSGPTATGTALTSPPSDAGQYTVRASFAGNPNYNGSHDDKTVNVAKADSTTSVSWSDWTFDTTAHLASATVKGVGGALIGTPDPTFAYYSGRRLRGRR